MMRAAFIALPFISVLFFAPALSGALALMAAYTTPAAPLAVGILVDALYYAPGAAAFPFYTIVGLGVSVAALLVRRFVETSIMRG